MKKLLQTLFFFLLVTQICSAQWYQQNSGTTKKLRDIVFINQNTGIAIGDSGTILRTTNGGSIWTLITTAVTNDFTGMCFIDANNGWIVAGDRTDDSSILHTFDGGVTWSTQLIRPLTILRDVTFIDANNGWVVGGFADSLLSFHSFILRTTNGGTSWNEIINDTIYGNKVYFVNENNGWILSNEGVSGRISRTTNEGESWTLQFVAGWKSTFNDIAFRDAQGIVVGWKGDTFSSYGLIVTTTDAGSNWRDTSITRTPHYEDNGLHGVYLISTNVIMVVGTRGAIFQTLDGGVTWNEQASGINNDLFGICFADNQNGWAVGDGGIILHTTNGGVSFVEEEEIDEVPTEFLLSQNYPNPFNPSTKIKYSVPQSSNVVIKVFDILGNEIETLVNEEKPVGTYEVTWYAEQLPSGVYFYQLKAGSFIETKKMLLLK